MVVTVGGGRRLIREATIVIAARRCLIAIENCPDERRYGSSATPSGQVADAAFEVVQ